MVERLLDVVDKVVGVFKTARESDKVGRNAGGIKLIIGELAVGGTCRMQAAAASVGNVRFDRNDFEPFHKRFRLFSAAFDAETDNSASAARAIFLRKSVVGIAFKRRIFHPRDAGIGLQIFCDGKSVFAMASHSDVQAFKTEIENERMLRALDRAEITHKLRRAFGDKRAFFAKLGGIGYAVIAVVRGAKTGKFALVRHPIEFAAVNDCSAHGCAEIGRASCRERV